jgi:transposase
MEFSQICYSSCHFDIEMPLSQEDSARAIALVHVDFSIREAANSLGFARSSVHRAVLRFRQTRGYTRRPGSGRRRSTSARDNRYITMLSLRNRHMTAVKIRNQLERVREVNVNERTVRRRLGEANLGAYRPATSPELLRSHRVSRLLFAQEHLNWNLEQWKSVLFSDESDLQMDGREFGEDQKNAMHLAIFLKGSVLMEDQLWYGEVFLGKPVHSWFLLKEAH